METITANQLKKLLNEANPPKLIDVRTPGEFAQVHITSAYNIPLTDLNEAAVKSVIGDAQKAYFICHAGARSQKACEQLDSVLGIPVVSIEGGTSAAIQAGIEVIRGQGVMSLERQVRIAAGVFVLVGTLGSILVETNMIWISAFVGAGLIFSGITNTCGMALVLGRMPWNRTNTCKN